MTIRKMMWLCLLACTVTASAQYTPTAYLMFDASGNPFPAGSGAPLGYIPPSFTCYTNVTGSVLPCNFSGVGTTPVQISSTFVGVPANSQVLLYIPATATLTIAASCAGSYFHALVAATGSTAFLVKDLTTSATLCTATFAGSGTVATWSGPGGTVSPGDDIEIVGPASADATLATLGVSIYATR